MNIRRLKKRLFDRSKRSAVYHLWNHMADSTRFHKRSASTGVRTQRALRARLVRQYHIVEKGLALRDPYETLSRLRVAPLVADIELYRQRYGDDDITASARQALHEYAEYMQTDPRSNSTQLERARQAAQTSPEAESATIEIKRAEIVDQATLDEPELFFTSRHSIRQFADEPVDEDTLYAAIRMAQKTPSVCNRQAWRVRWFRDEKEKAKALRYQAGNRGFGDQAPVVFAVTADVQNYLHVGERNQAYVDGGMFAMSLVYALHAHGLGTCCLNWGKDRRQDVRAKKALNIPDNETIVMLIAVGHLPESMPIARSTRYEVDEMISVH